MAATRSLRLFALTVVTGLVMLVTASVPSTVTRRETGEFVPAEMSLRAEWSRLQNDFALLRRATGAQNEDGRWEIAVPVPNGKALVDSVKSGKPPATALDPMLRETLADRFAAIGDASPEKHGDMYIFYVVKNIELSNETEAAFIEAFQQVKHRIDEMGRMPSVPEIVPRWLTITGLAAGGLAIPSIYFVVVWGSVWAFADTIQRSREERSQWVSPHRRTTVFPFNSEEPEMMHIDEERQSMLRRTRLGQKLHKWREKTAANEATDVLKAKTAYVKSKGEFYKATGDIELDSLGREHIKVTRENQIGREKDRDALRTLYQKVDQEGIRTEIAGHRADNAEHRARAALARAKERKYNNPSKNPRELSIEEKEAEIYKARTDRISIIDSNDLPEDLKARQREKVDEDTVKAINKLHMEQR